MNKFEKWFLRRLCRKQVAQGVYHNKNTVELATYIVSAWSAEFTEDNIPTKKAELNAIMGQAIVSGLNLPIHK